MSSTNHINAVSMASPWNKASEPGENATPKYFRNHEFADKFFAGLDTYAPSVNTVRLDVDQVTVRDPHFQEFVRSGADAGYMFIFNFTDPNFQHRKDVSPAYLDTNVADLSGVNDGRAIELDEHFTITRGDWLAGAAREDWGRDSDAYDPLDYLADGWQEVLDWVNAPGNEGIAAAIYGYELVNEPAAYADTPEGGLTYYRDMAELHDRVEGWGDARILVGGLRFSARFDALAEVAPGQSVPTLDLFREHFGEALVWSAHYYTGRHGDANADSPEDIHLPERLAYLGDDDIIVTEMNFDGDPNFDRQDLFETLSGEVPDWAAWTLLQPIFSGQTDKYHYARLAETLENKGIGMTWWSPVAIDGNLFDVRWGGHVVEERDAVAFALNMWEGNDAQAADGSGRDGEALQVSDAATHKSGAARILFGYDGDDTITGTDTPDYEGLNRFSNRRGFVGNSDDPDNPLTASNLYMHDKVYAGPGDDLVHLAGGDDFGFGNDGSDTVHGGTGHDVLVGGAGHDLLCGEAGDDVLEGGEGNDILIGGDGIDLMIGGSGADLFRLDGADEDRVHDFDADEDLLDITAWNVRSFDELSFSDRGDGRVTVTGNGHAATFDDISREVLSEYFETLLSDDPSDGRGVSGSDAAGELMDGAGAARSRGGFDALDGGAEDDMLMFNGGHLQNSAGFGGAGRDVLVMTDGARARIRDIVRDEDGTEPARWQASAMGELDGELDRHVADDGSGQHEVDMGTLDCQGPDLFVRADPDRAALPAPRAAKGEVLTGGPSDDVLRSGAGDDTLQGGAGDDTLIFEGGSVHRQVGLGGAGADTFVMRDGAEARLRDFEFDRDRIDLSDWGVQSVGDLHIGFDMPGKLYVRDGDNQVRIDAETNDLTEENFVFVHDFL